MKLTRENNPKVPLSKKNNNGEGSRSKRKFIFFIAFYYIRRIILALTIINVHQSLFWSFFSMVFQFIIKIILLVILERSLATRFDNQNEIFNECMIMIVMYHMLCFSDNVPDPQAKSKIGIACIISITFHIFYNLRKMVIRNIIQLKRVYKRYYAIWLYKRK